ASTGEPVHRRFPALASVVAIGACALVAAGCGNGSPRGVANLPATTAATGGTRTPADSRPGGELALYARCMRTHGISNFPDQGAFGTSTAIRTAKGRMAQISQGEASSPRFQSAQRACAKYYGPSAPATQVSPRE